MHSGSVSVNRGRNSPSEEVLNKPLTGLSQADICIYKYANNATIGCD